MDMTSIRHDNPDQRGVLRVVLFYALFAALWILLSDTVSKRLINDAALMSWVSIGKGLLFVTVTSLLLFFLLRRLVDRMLAGNKQLQAVEGERLRTMQLFATIADHTDDIIFAKDTAGRYLVFNRAAGRYLDRSAGEVLGQDDRALFPPEQANMLMAADRRVMAEEKIATSEETLNTAIGPRTLLVTKGPLHDETGKVTGVFGIAHDINERKQAEDALRESETTYRMLHDNLTNSVAHCRIIFENDTPVDIEYISVNPAFAEITGITEGVVGRRISDVIPGYCRNNPESLATFGRVARTGEPARWEHYLAELDRWFSFMIYSPVPEEAVIIAENITKRKKAELSLRQQTDELIARNEELERFNSASVGREMDMIELKKQVNTLSGQLGLEPPYSLAFLADKGNNGP